jgi:G3E family GTPase
LRPLPVTVIGGYLGAGKTTLVNHLLRHAGRRIAVAVNDFGALPIDRDLILGADGDVLTLAGGCVCCSIGADFLGGLSGLALRENLDCVVVEASGVALPDSIARTVALVAGLKHEATLVVVDCETVRAQSDDRYVGDTILRQLADADLVVANKIDLVAASGRDILRTWLTTKAPRAEIVFAERGQVAPEIALGGRARSPFACDEPAPAHDLSAVESVSLEIAGRVDVAALARALSEASLGLVRAKGFAQDVSGAWKTIQIVGRRYAIADAASRAGTGRIVCIAHGRKIDRERIAAAVAATAL